MGLIDRIVRFLIALLTFAAPAGLTAAGPLRWEATEITVNAPPLAESVEAVFTFTNASDKPATIGDVHSSCGCTVPKLAKKLYAPGESGEIRAVFTIGERIGLQEKAIMVTTSGDEPSHTSLTLRVNIPTLFEVKPYFVIWNVGEATTPKSITLRLLAPDVLGFGSVMSRHAGFDAVAVAGTEPGRMDIAITPQTTAQGTNGAIVVSLKSPEGRTREITLYAMVRGTPTPAAAAPAPTAPAAAP